MAPHVPPVPHAYGGGTARQRLSSGAATDRAGGNAAAHGLHGARQPARRVARYSCQSTRPSSCRPRGGRQRSARAAARLTHCNTVLKPIAPATELLGYATGERRLDVEL